MAFEPMVGMNHMSHMSHMAYTPMPSGPLKRKWEDPQAELGRFVGVPLGLKEALGRPESCHRRVKSFNSTKGYGFIISEARGTLKNEKVSSFRSSNSRATSRMCS